MKNKSIFKGRSFAARLIALVICAAVSTAVFYPAGSGAVENSELRGVWVATVANIDYPSRQTTDSETLKSELVSILDNCEAMGFNAVFFQVRPCGDALYKSSIFPWSRYLTGEQGVAPDNGFDPLAFAVEEAHARGIELHAWINPYRITNTASDNEGLSSNNPAVVNPALVLKDSTGKMYYNPGDQGSIDLIVNGALEIAENYDVDGIHLDDYFYPDSEFDDSVTYSFYSAEYPDRDAWRRANVDRLIKTLDERLHAVRPEIDFGISPRGIWANKSEMAEGSDTNGGGSYTNIFADSRGWVKNGWVDYIMPQIYWYIGYDIADYNVLCSWWSDVVVGTDVKLYIGEGVYRTTTSELPVWQGDSGINELKTHFLNGRQNPNISGYCCYTYNNFINNPAAYSLMQEINAEPAAQAEPEDDGDIAPTPPAISDGTESLPEPDTGLSTDESVQVSGEAYINRFEDMDEYWWAMDAVNDLAANGIIRGRSETEFDPEAYITRADNTVLLLRVIGKEASFEENFDDVYEGAYYYDEIGMARALGIASGVGDNLFDPDASVMRQDMATLAYRVLVQEGMMSSIPNTASLNQFSDSDDIDFYAREAMAACVDAGLMSGYGDSTINPKGNATRVEVALFIYRIKNLIAEHAEQAAMI